MENEPKPLIINSDEGELDKETPIELAKAGTLASRETAFVDEEFTGEGEGQIAIDVYQTPDHIVVESPIAGVSPEDLDISISNESVTIKGVRRHTDRVKNEDYFYQECYWGKFSRAVILPQEINAEEADAQIKNGVLVITLPKLRRAKAKKLKVKS